MIRFASLLFGGGNQKETTNFFITTHPRMMMNGNSTGNRMDTHSNDESNESPNCDTLLNLTILDPAKYGWSVLGGIQNVCPPHEVRCCYIVL